MNRQKRIMAINDLSCFGKCSLTVALPILSAAGVETCVIPTAVLSAHTGFSGYTFRDLTADLIPVAGHWKELNLAFDGIYTGYLGSKEQVDCVEHIIDMFPTNFILVDPVMGDNGVMYDGFDAQFAQKMKQLLKKASVIVPNVTEAAFLTGIPYEENTHSEDYICSLIDGLKRLCGGHIVLTGVHSGPNTLGTAVYDKKSFSIIQREKADVEYSGTGDVFASAFAACTMLGADTKKSAEIAADFILDCIYETKKTSGNRNYGINFEPCIQRLLNVFACIKI